jgi:hypothetical protein
VRIASRQQESAAHKLDRCMNRGLHGNVRAKIQGSL